MYNKNFDAKVVFDYFVVEAILGVIVPFERDTALQSGGAKPRALTSTFSALSEKDRGLGTFATATATARQAAAARA
ncbi:hypothetical protein M7I_2369 [Glarea lozoyensis 74030]|uniref:Uncharacterized protein n=1 Tax=Glarea lozoyensis (strain ATCC 74030 / MF5533) TaxID=1104152 RepID=H0EIK9_GLAL7|nr:hypothetical protein M7I_2369 [Glarea lozoyensis 74030]